MLRNPYQCGCGCTKYDKGRAWDGRRAYRCRKCGSVHTAGMQGRQKRVSPQRERVTSSMILKEKDMCHDQDVDG